MIGDQRGAGEGKKKEVTSLKDRERIVVTVDGLGSREFSAISERHD